MASAAPLRYGVPVLHVLDVMRDVLLPLVGMEHAHHLRAVCAEARDTLATYAWPADTWAVHTRSLAAPASLTTANAARFVACFPATRTLCLKVHGTEQGTAEMCAVVAAPAALHVLRVRTLVSQCMELRQRLLARLADALLQLPHLRTLCVKDLTLAADVGQGIMDAVGHMPHLEVLALSFYAPNKARIVAMLRTVPHLRQLELQGDQSAPQNDLADIVSEAVDSLPRLRSLTLEAYYIRLRHVAALLRRATWVTELRVLHVCTHVHIGDSARIAADIRVLASAIADAPKLSSFGLQCVDNYDSSSIMDALRARGPAAADLTAIELWVMHTPTPSLHALLAHAAKTCVRLSLDVTFVAGDDLVAVLRECVALTHLRLIHSSMTEAQFGELAEGMTHIPRLSVLDIGSVHVMLSGYEQNQDALLPHLPQMRRLTRLQCKDLSCAGYTELRRLAAHGVVPLLRAVIWSRVGIWP